MSPLSLFVFRLGWRPLLSVVFAELLLHSFRLGRKIKVFDVSHVCLGYRSLGYRDMGADGGAGFQPLQCSLKSHCCC